MYVALFFFAEFGRSHLKAAHGGLVSGLRRVLCAIIHPSMRRERTNRSALTGKAGCMTINFVLAQISSRVYLLLLLLLLLLLDSFGLKKS